jgi:hypothetical protein
VQAIVPPPVGTAGTAVMVAGGIGPPTPVAFDPANPATPLACAVKGTSQSIAEYARYDACAAALTDALPVGAGAARPAARRPPRRHADVLGPGVRDRHGGD